jgi:diaminopimelate epimerase
MNINFTKAVASGNDFIIVNNKEKRLRDRVADFGNLARFLCRKKYSVGADGLLILENSKKADFKMRILNPDGSEVTMCGNGARASALYAYHKKWCGSSLKIETGAGVIEARIKDESVRMKVAPPKDVKLERNIGIGKTIMDIHTVNTGVPHVIHFVENVENYPVKEMGRKIRYHRLFEPEGTNADFVELIDKSTISVRTYERGVEDETLACGTGALASAIISNLVNGVSEPVNVITRGKDTLKVYFKKDHNRFCDTYLEGGAHIVFEGGINYV